MPDFTASTGGIVAERVVCCGRQNSIICIPLNCIARSRRLAARLGARIVYDAHDFYRGIEPAERQLSFDRNRMRPFLNRLEDAACRRGGRGHHSQRRYRGPDGGRFRPSAGRGSQLS